MRTINELLADAPVFEGMNAEHLEFIAGCAGNEVYQPGDFLLRENEAANRFYVIRRGTVALETFVPHKGALTLETLEPGEALGWSWLVSPYRSQFDARALETTHVIAFDAACLREKADGDPALGYELMKRFVPVIVDRLQATRLRLLDVYGHAVGS